MIRSHSPSRLPRSSAGSSGCFSSAASAGAPCSSSIFGILLPVEHAAHQHQNARTDAPSEHRSGHSSRAASTSDGVSDASRMPASSASRAAARRSPRSAGRPPWREDTARAPRTMRRSAPGRRRCVSASQHPEGPLRTFLHHVVEAVGHAVRQTLDKGVLRGQRGEQLLRVPASPVTKRAISAVNSSARPITARNSCCRCGSGSIMAAVNMV